jgi:potassium/hydrogen antiporter
VSSAEPFALLVVLVAAVGLVAVLSNRLAHRVKLPAAALFLVGAAIAAKVIPALHRPSQHAVEQVVAVALACILFDGGMNIGWARFRSAVAPIAATGVLGTFLTVLAAAMLVHFAFGLAWYISLLVATAIAPTDPAVVFSVLGQREVAGRAGIILEGEAGAIDPVGIALMVSLIAAAGVSAGAFAHAASEFAVQMAVGLAAGVIGGRALLWFTRRVPLPSEGLYPPRMLAGELLLFGVATLAHGSADTLHEIAPKVGVGAVDRDLPLQEVADLDSISFMALVTAIHDRTGIHGGRCPASIAAIMGRPMSAKTSRRPPWRAACCAISSAAR